MSVPAPEGNVSNPDTTWCFEAVQSVSRTFALTVDLLEEPMATEICVGYLLCRLADTVEDATHIPPTEQAALLRTYGDALDPDTDTTIDEFATAIEPWLPATEDRSAEWTVVAHAPTVVATFHEMSDDVQNDVLPPVLEMVRGMAGIVDRYAEEGGLRIQDRTELERYCYYVAGTVGTLITNLLTRGDVSDETEATLRDRSEEFGLLLQLVNVSKDVYEDFHAENNVYLPADWLADEGLEPEEVVDPEHRSASARVVNRTADLARSFLDDTQRYLETMPLRHGNTLSAWLVPYLLAVGTLRELRDRPEDALTDKGVKVSRGEVFAVIEAASVARRDTIEGLRESVARGALH